MLDLLVATRDELLARGHAKDTHENADGGVCVYEAFAIACEQAGRSQDDLADAIGFDDEIAVVAWNDDPATTFEDVLCRLNDAIAARTLTPEPALV